MILGYAVFAELPDAPAFLGSALILSGGLLAALRRPAAPLRRHGA
ncbi:hypothetical protein ABNQ38_30990 [Azospirillum sp. A29]